MKRISALVLSLVMALSLCVPAWGAATVELSSSESVVPSSIEYTSGDTVKLMSDITLSGLWTITNTVTIDLNGYTLDRSGGGSVVYANNGGNLTVIDSSADGNGTITGATAFYVGKDSTATLKSGNIVSDGVAVSMWGNNGTFNMEGGAIVGMTVGNGNDSGTVMNISAGTITGCLFHPQKGTLNITGGTLSGPTAIYVKSGTINISGGTITGTEADGDYKYSSSGANTTGDALVIDSCKYPGGAPVVNITGGDFSSVNAAPVASYVGNGSTDLVGGFIKGGTFSAEPEDSLVAEGYQAFALESGSYIVAVPCKVSFDPNGGTGSVLTETVPAGELSFSAFSELFAANITAPENKELAGWATTKDATEAIGETYNVTGEVTFYAVWEEKGGAGEVQPPVDVSTPNEVGSIVDNTVLDAVKASNDNTVTVSTPVEGNANAQTTVELVSDEAKVAIGSASAADITTVLEAAEESVTDSVTDAVEEKVSDDAEIAAYLDIDIKVVLNGEAIGEITELPKPIKVVIPAASLDFDELKAGFTRKVSVLRFHDNTVEKLSAKLESNGDVSFESNLFSTYAVVYEDVKTSGGYYPGYYVPPVSSTEKDNDIKSPETFDAGIALYVGVSVMGAIGTVVLSKKRED